MSFSAIYLGIMTLLKSVPGLFSKAVLAAIPREIYAGIYAGWLKFVLFYDLLIWAYESGNAAALAQAMAIAKQFVTEVKGLMANVSGSALVEAAVDSSALFETSRTMLNAAIADFEKQGFAPDHPVTKAALAHVMTLNVVAKYAPPADPAPVDPDAAPSDSPGMADPNAQ